MFERVNWIEMPQGQINIVGFCEHGPDPLVA